ncbi:MAG: hypothetical protein H0T76_28855 [Nannocystis sp.]|nr:hypothetical protein [Nannocystis sp.]MBA3550504.1 hypothetical protein [Nannocystis sp.]
MPFIKPTDDRLRRIHRVKEENLEHFKGALARQQDLDPINIVKIILSSTKTLLIVANGTHRTQAALEQGLPELEYRLVTAAKAANEASTRGLNFDDLVQRAIAFRVGHYSFPPY